MEKIINKISDGLIGLALRDYKDGTAEIFEKELEKAVKKLNMELKRTRPYSPWQNGKVERSHREDGKILYGREVFTSEKELKKKVARHEKKYNSTAKTVLDFKSPDQVVAEYFSKCNKCLDS